MLVDGTSLGLGVLLERLGNSTATPVGNLKVTPKAKANGTRPAKAQVKVDSGILQKMGLQKSGNFLGPEKFEGKKRGGGGVQFAINRIIKNQNSGSWVCDLSGTRRFFI